MTSAFELGIMSTEHRTSEEIRSIGFKALREALGVEDGLRFLRLYTGSTGDYTAERDLILGAPTLEELVEEARELEARRQQAENPAAADVLVSHS